MGAAGGPTLLFGGLPLILPRNPPGSVHASEAFAERTGTGVLYADLDDLAARTQVTFHHHADRLLDLLRRVAR